MLRVVSVQRLHHGGRSDVDVLRRHGPRLPLLHHLHVVMKRRLSRRPLCIMGRDPSWTDGKTLLFTFLYHLRRDRPVCNICIYASEDFRVFLTDKP